MDRRHSWRRVIAGMFAAMAALITMPSLTSADHCPGFEPAAATFRAATNIVLVRITAMNADPTEQVLYGSYDFQALRRYKGDLGSTFRMTRAEVSCQWPPNDTVAVGDRYVFALGEPIEGALVRSYWPVGPGDRILDGGHLQHEPFATLAALERAIAQSALPDTAINGDVGDARPMGSLWWVLVVAFAVGGAALFWRRRRSTTGRAPSEEPGHAWLGGDPE